MDPTRILLSSLLVLGMAGCHKAPPKAPPAPPPAGPPAVDLAKLPPVDGVSLAHTCAGCHGTEGRIKSAAFVSLAGLPAADLVRTMKDFRTGKRPSTLMGHVAKGLSDRDLEALAAHFAKLPKDAGKGGQP